VAGGADLPGDEKHARSPADLSSSGRHFDRSYRGRVPGLAAGGGPAETTGGRPSRGLLADTDAGSQRSAGSPGGVGRPIVSFADGSSGFGPSSVLGGRGAAALLGDHGGLRCRRLVVTKIFLAAITYEL